MTRAKTHWQTLAVLGAVSAAMLLAPDIAHGQNALGSGNRLDANPARGSGRINAPRAVEDFRARNLIVTGNVAGGRGFRGSVGYGAESDFRGVTGVDDLFEFRAGSALSAPPIVTSPGWQQLRFGRDLGALSLRRGDGGVTSGMVIQPQLPSRYDEFEGRRAFEDRIRLNAALENAGSLARIERESPSRPIGLTRAEESGELMAFESSPLRGVTVTAADDPRLQRGLTPYDVVRLREEKQPLAVPGRVEQFGGGFTALLDPGRVESAAPGSRVEEGASDGAMLALLERIASRYAGRTDVQVHLDPRLIEQLEEEYQDLREQLARMTPGARWRVEADRLAGEQREAEVAPEPWQPGQVDLDVPGADREDEEPDIEEESQGIGVGESVPGELDRLFDALRHGERVEQFATEGNTRFDELMAQGEQALRAGEYFNAERRFMRALRIFPGHPIAMIGAAHAQLGAGLQLPAALSIRRVLTAHPELIDAKYDAGLVPSRPRLVQVVDATKQRLERTPGDEGEYGLVMAYIGRQLDDRALIERGLSLMDEANSDDSFAAVLRNVWLMPDAAADEEPQK